MKPVVVLSSCLGDEACRYNGQALREPFVAALPPFVTFIRVCPEVAIGLGVPRDPIRIVRADGGVRLVQPATGKDVTARMVRFARSFLEGLPEVDGFLLKSRSPSCGIRHVKLHGGGAPSGRVPGLFGGAVLQRFPLVAAEDEGRLLNFDIREHFLTRVFASARWRALCRKPSMAALVRFHATHKLLLLAHDERRMRELGRVVANHGGASLKAVFQRYGDVLGLALERPARPGARINVCQHAFGFVSDRLTAGERRHFLALLQKVRDRRTTFGALAALIRSWTIRFNVAYLADQVLLEPFPEELVSVSDSGKGREF